MEQKRETERGNSVLVKGPNGEKWMSRNKARTLVEGDGEIWAYVGETPAPLKAPPVKPRPIEPIRKPRTQEGAEASGDD